MNDKRISIFTFVSLIITTICLTINSGVVMSATKSKLENKAKKIVIAHRGASGYVAEHSLASKAMAHAMNVDYIEQDVVMTKDDQIVVLHDPYLDRVTDVMEQFPNRSRQVFGGKTLASD